MKAVADTSVLIALGKLGYLKLVNRLFDDLVIAESVFEEVEDTPVSHQIQELIDGGFAEVESSSKHQLLNILSSSVGKGEAETIALALEVKADLAVLDDFKARKLARKLQIKIVGTLGILKTLMDLKALTEKPQELCLKLKEQGFWIDYQLCKEILKG